MARTRGPGGRALGQGYFGKNAERTTLEILQDYKHGTLCGRNGGEWETAQKLRCLVAKGENQSLVLDLGERKKGQGTSKAVASFAATFKQHKLRSQDLVAVV